MTDKDEQYKRELDTHYFPIIKMGHMYFSHAASHGEIALKWSFLLNGGALGIAIPAVRSLNATADIRLCATLFTIGILCSALTVFWAFKNFQNHASAKYREAEKNVSYIKIRLGFSSENLEKSSLEGYENKLIINKKEIEKTARLGIFFGFCAYISFIIGCFELIKVA